MFRFRLQKVLDLRTRQVDQEAVQLRVALTAQQELAVQREALLSRLHSLVRQVGSEREAGQPLHMWSLQTSYLADQRRRLAALRHGERTAAENVVRQRARLREAQRRKEVLEHLSIRQRRKWQLEQSRQECKELDEVGAIRATVTSKA